MRRYVQLKREYLQSDRSQRCWNFFRSVEVRRVEHMGGTLGRGNSHPGDPTQSQTGFVHLRRLVRIHRFVYLLQRPDRSDRSSVPRVPLTFWYRRKPRQDPGTIGFQVPLSQLCGFLSDVGLHTINTWLCVFRGKGSDRCCRRPTRKRTGQTIGPSDIRLSNIRQSESLENITCISGIGVMIEPEAIYTRQWQEEVCTHGSEMPISVYASLIRIFDTLSGSSHSVRRHATR